MSVTSNPTPRPAAPPPGSASRAQAARASSQVAAETRLVPPPHAAVPRPLGRLPFGFGRRFFLLLVVGFVWLGPAWWNREFVYVMFAWDALALFAWFLDLLQLPRPSEFELRRVWTATVALNTPSRVQLELRNRGRVGVSATLVDDVPRAIRREPPTVELDVAAGKVHRAEYEILPLERGDSHLGNVFLRYRGAWQLAERRAIAQLDHTVRVYPNLEESKRHLIYLIRSRQIELEKRLKRRRGLGCEFESLREYRDGDERRDICWSATARRGKLITKVFQIERSQAVYILLDAGRLLRARPDPEAGLTKFDFAVNAALSLAQVALYSGDRVGMLVYGRRPQQRIEAGRGTHHLRQIVDSLALARVEPYEADHARAAQVLLQMQKQRALVVWVTDLAETPATPDVIESAALLMPPHLVLFVVLAQAELAELVAARPADARQMYRYVAAQEMLQRRELLLRQLRQQGALTVEVTPGKLSTSLVNHYLEIKERSLL